MMHFSQSKNTHNVCMYESQEIKIVNENNKFKTQKYWSI